MIWTLLTKKQFDFEPSKNHDPFGGGQKGTPNIGELHAQSAHTAAPVQETLSEVT